MLFALLRWVGGCRLITLIKCLKGHKSLGLLPREGIAKQIYSFIGPVGHNIWWENRLNGSLRPKDGPQLQNGLEIRHSGLGCQILRPLIT